MTRPFRAIARYEGRQRLRGSLYLGVGAALFALMYALFFPSIQESSAEIEEYVQNLPPAVRAAFGAESLTTIEGFLATEFYQFVWLLLLGLYLAYRAAGTIAGDVESERMDLVLAAPVSRASVVTGTYLSFLVPVVVLNLVAFVGVYASVLLAGETIAITRLVVVHALSVPYLLACTGLGLVASVATARTDLAQRGTVGLIFGLFLVDSVSTATDGFEWVGAVSPTRYYDPTAVLVRAEYDLVGAAVMLVVAVVLVAVSRAVFRRRDLR